MKKIEKRIISVFFLVFISLCGVVTLLRSGSIDATFSSKVLLNGELARQVESDFDESLAFHSLAISFWAAVEYSLFREGKEGVVIGKNGWLYTSEEFVKPPNAESAFESNRLFVDGVARYFKQADIELVVALVPPKAVIYPKNIEFEPDPYMSAVYQRVSTHLASIEKVLDLKGEFLQAEKTPLFLRTDTHWTPQGATLAAEIISRKVRKLKLELAEKKFTREDQSERVWVGDLFSFIPLEPYFAKLGPEPDVIHPYLAIDNESDALFGGSDAEVVLVGTSYSANTVWSFESALKLAMSADVVNFSMEGEGPFKPMIEYLRSEDFRDIPPKLVIWEIPVRYMPVEYALDFDFERDMLSSIEP